jgi:Zn-dependent peptidase ImmA (M78 family)/transcriptional regulator with XRE-family HTH domain
MTFFSERLSWIRKKRGLTKSALASLVELDLRSISAYEAGEFEPKDETELELVKALGVRRDFFKKGALEGPESNQVSFRAFSKLSASKRDMALGSAAVAFALNHWISQRFDLHKPAIPDLRNENSPEGAAMVLRDLWGLGEQPVSNMVHLLEYKGVRVFSLALDVSDVDACCTWHNNEPFIFLNTKKSNARRRFDAAHELGHLVLHRHGNYDGRDVEREADEFASAFLMPRNGFVATAPKFVDLKSVMPIKIKWGVSVAAYIYRLNSLGLLSEWHYRTLFKQISQRGYRTAEPSDSKIEFSKLAEQVLGQLRKESIGLREISIDLGLKEQDIADLLFDLTLFGFSSGTDVPTQVRSSKAKLTLAVDNS